MLGSGPMLNQTADWEVVGSAPMLSQMVAVVGFALSTQLKEESALSDSG